MSAMRILREAVDSEPTKAAAFIAQALGALAGGVVGAYHMRRASKDERKV